MGECIRRRGGKCKFRHLTQSEYDEEIYGRRRERESEQTQCDPYSKPQENNASSISPPEAKRQRFDSTPQNNVDFSRDRGDFVRSIEDVTHNNDIIVTRDLPLRDYRERDWERDRDRRNVDEILMLRKQVESLKNEIAVLKNENFDLRATNDFLLEKVSNIICNFFYNIILHYLYSYIRFRIRF